MNVMTIKESKVLEYLKDRYQHDTIMLIATAHDNVPSVRSIDTFYFEDSFYIVSDLSSTYVKELSNNQEVMISDGAHNRFSCKAIVLGHPLEENNKQIRDIFLRMFSWYEEVNNEELESVCLIKVTPYKGYFHKEKQGYAFDLRSDTCRIEPVRFHIDARLEPIF